MTIVSNSLYKSDKIIAVKLKHQISLSELHAERYARPYQRSHAAKRREENTIWSISHVCMRVYARLVCNKSQHQDQAYCVCPVSTG